MNKREGVPAPIASADAPTKRCRAHQLLAVKPGQQFSNVDLTPVGPAPPWQAGRGGKSDWCVTSRHSRSFFLLYSTRLPLSPHCMGFVSVSYRSIRRPHAHRRVAGGGRCAVSSLQNEPHCNYSLPHCDCMHCTIPFCLCVTCLLTMQCCLVQVWSAGVLQAETMPCAATVPATGQATEAGEVAGQRRPGQRRQERVATPEGLCNERGYRYVGGG